MAINPETAHMIRRILAEFQVQTISDTASNLQDIAVEDQCSLSMIRAFVFLVDNLAHTTVDIMNKYISNSDITVDEYYATIYASSSKFTGEDN